jgi:hypothetical protein
MVEEALASAFAQMLEPSRQNTLRPQPKQQRQTWTSTRSAFQLLTQN